MISYTKLNIGTNMPFMWNIHGCIEQAIREGMTVVQFFMGNTQWPSNRANITNSDISKTNDLLRRFPTYVYTHFPLCVNFVGNVKQLAWNGDESVDGKLQVYINYLESEMKVISRLNTLYLKGVVIHTGSNIDRNKGHLILAKTLDRITYSQGCYLLLENSAGEGTKLCRTLAEIKTVLVSLKSTDAKKYVKVCIDTAHIWGQGDYNLSQISEVYRLFNDIENIIGLDTVHLVHLNDSKVPLGSKKDMHASLGQGYIWKDNIESLQCFITMCNIHKIPMIIETHTPIDCFKKVVALYD